jgi:hypothetical protein
MTIRLPSATSSRATVSAGTHLGALWSIILMGTQRTEYAGETKERVQIRLGFELADAFYDDGNPRLVSQTYTFSWHPNSNFRNAIESWCGNVDEEEFELDALIGRAAILGIGHGEGARGPYAYIQSILAVPPAQPDRVSLVNESVLLDYGDNFDKAVFDAQPDWLRQKLAAAPEYRQLAKGAVPQSRLVGRLQDEVREGGLFSAPRQRSPTTLSRDIDDEIPFISNDIALEPGISRKRAAL